MDYKRLHDRAIKKLTEKGLYHQNRDENNYKEYPKLRLTFDLTYLGGDPGSWLYTQNLEVLEFVKTKRDSGKHILAITWTSPKKLLPRIVEDVPIEQIESDLDELLEQFISDYKHGNTLKE